METYSALRAFADSWMLLLMFVFFLGVVVWVFLPRNRKHHDDSSQIPFRHEDRPAPPDDAAPNQETR